MITLKLAAAQVQGFQSYKMMSTMRALSDSFEVTCPNSPSAQNLIAGSACEVLIDDQLMITGIIDRVAYNSDTRIITWTGRDNTRDLIDSFPVVSTGEWKNVTAKEIISFLASPFGITVEGEDGPNFDQYNVELDAPIHTTIAEICSLSGLLATSTSEGNVLLTKALPLHSEIVLQEGRNITSMEMIADVSKTFGCYTVLGQQTFIGNDQISATQPFGRSIHSEDNPRKFTTISPNSVDFASAQTQADWIAAEKESSKEYLKVTIAEYSNVQPNTLIPFVSDTLRIYSKRLIESVIWDYSPEEGHRTTFILVNPSKYGGPPEEFTKWL